MECSDKLLELREWVDANITESATRRRTCIIVEQEPQPHRQRNRRYLWTISMCNKLEPHWTGPWIVQKILDATSVKVKIETREQVVHINRIRPSSKRTPQSRKVIFGHPCYSLIETLAELMKLPLLITRYHRMILLLWELHAVYGSSAQCTIMAIRVKTLLTKIWFFIGAFCVKGEVCNISDTLLILQYPS